MAGQRDGKPYEAMRALLSDRPIAFHPMMARLLGGINEALLFQQLAYWSDKGDDPDWIFKTQAELEAETTLSRTQQESARKRLRALGVVEETKRGLPAKLYYRVDWEAIFALLEGGGGAAKDAGNLQPRMRGSGGQGRGKTAGKTAENPQPFRGTKSTDREDDRDPSTESNDPLLFLSREDAERIAFLIRDIGREFADQASAKSSATRSCRLYAASGLSLDEFFDAVQAARVRTKRYQGTITAEPVDLGGRMVRPRMSYFFSVLSGMLGGEKMSSTGS